MHRLSLSILAFACLLFLASATDYQREQDIDNVKDKSLLTKNLVRMQNYPQEKIEAEILDENESINTQTNTDSEIDEVSEYDESNADFSDSLERRSHKEILNFVRRNFQWN